MPTIALILVVLCALSYPAEARKLHRALPPIVRQDPVQPFIFTQNPFSGATSLHVTMTRERKARVLR